LGEWSSSGDFAQKTKINELLILLQQSLLPQSHSESEKEIQRSLKRELRVIARWNAPIRTSREILYQQYIG
jgi:hypothetical protein